jgi:23S rRNA pseudouridine1911/1915/1917 synthase
VFEDEHLIVLDKQQRAWSCIRPGQSRRHAGQRADRALRRQFARDRRRASSGIVHRIDKDTTGLMVAAKTEKAHTSLGKQLRRMRSSGCTRRSFRACRAEQAGMIDAPVGRSPLNWQKMAVLRVGGKTRVRTTR